MEKRTGAMVTPEVMVPLVMTKPELDLVKARIDAMAAEVAKETGVTVPYQVGTMIELPRAALRAGEIAGAAEFFSSARTTSRRPRLAFPVTMPATSSAPTRRAASLRRIRS